MKCIIITLYINSCTIGRTFLVREIVNKKIKNKIKKIDKNDDRGIDGGRMSLLVFFLPISDVEFNKRPFI